jgi:ABC-2 type transport system ATP-binding protein
MALLHEPEILFLDEPTIGLDVLAKDRIREFLRAVNRERGVTIILTTHDLKDIEEICPRLMVINAGRVVYDGAVGELKARLGDRREIAVEFERDPGPVELPGAELVRDEGARKRYRFDRSAVSAFALMRALEGRYPVSDVSLEEAGIEDVIRELYRQMGREAPEAEELDTWTRGRAVVQ